MLPAIHGGVGHRRLKSESQDTTIRVLLQVAKSRVAARRQAYSSQRNLDTAVRTNCQLRLQLMGMLSDATRLVHQADTCQQLQNS